MYISMCLFALSMSISPGPVNLITLSTGVNYGFKNAMPFVSGATIGFTLLLLMSGLTASVLANYSQSLMSILGYAGCAFILYMGYHTLTAQPEVYASEAKIPSFLHGLLLQWLNPKAWIACLAGVSAFNLADSYSLLGLFVSLYFLICYLSIASWAYLGDKISTLLVKPENLRRFNRTMGSLLIALAIYLFYQLFHS